MVALIIIMYNEVIGSKATLYESACFACALLVHAIMHKPFLIELDILSISDIQLGISNDSHVIIYDNNETFGMFSAARLWWMFKAFGHKNVSILDGGLPRWLSDGLPVEESTVPDTKKLSYHAKIQSHIIRSMKDVEKAIRDGDIQVVDARSNERFDGVAPEPRPGLCSGHMIGSINLPFYNLFDKNSKTFASKNTIEQEFLKAGVDINKPIIATCGSGITACWIAFAAYLLGKEIPVYDGSWTEYAQYGPTDTIKLGVSSNTSS